MPETELKPSKVGAVLIGLVEICIFLFCGLMGVLILVLPKITPTLPEQGNSLAAAGAIYLGAGAFFLVFAIGTMMGKRWARTLMLILSWFWLASGILGMGYMVYLFPAFDKSLEATGQANPGMVMVVKAIMGAVFFFIFLLLPGMFILFYGRKKARQNFEAWDPQESWTDKCPAPVLAVSLCAGLGAVCIFPFMAFCRFVAPFFGTILDGWAGASVCTIVALALLYVAWGAYQLKMEAWWTQLGVFLFWGISAVWTFSQHTLIEFDEKMGFPAATLARAKEMDVFNNTQFFAIYTGIIFAVYIGYLLFIRKYFKKA